MRSVVTLCVAVTLVLNAAGCSQRESTSADEAAIRQLIDDLEATMRSEDGDLVISEDRLLRLPPGLMMTTAPRGIPLRRFAPGHYRGFSLTTDEIEIAGDFARAWGRFDVVGGSVRGEWLAVFSDAPVRGSTVMLFGSGSDPSQHDRTPHIHYPGTPLGEVGQGQSGVECRESERFAWILSR